MKAYSEKALKTRERIVETAARLFYLHGYHATGLDRIIGEAGVTKGNFYYHFKTKEALAAATVEQQRGETFRALGLAPEHPGEGPLAVLFRVLERMTERARCAPGDGDCRVRGCYFGNLALEMSMGSELVRRAVRGVFDEVRGGIAALLAQARDAGELAPRVEPEQAAAMIVSLMEGAVLLGKSAQDENDAHAAVAFIKGWLSPP